MRAAMKPLPTLMRRCARPTSRPASRPRLWSSVPTSPRSRRSPSSPRPASRSSSRARPGRSSAATRWGTSSPPGARTWSGSPGLRGRRARKAPRPHRLHGGGEVDDRPRGRRALRAPVRRHGRGDRAAARADPELFERGEPEFRRIEEQIVAEALAGPPPFIALGGGAVLSEKTRSDSRPRVHVLVEVDLETAWERVAESEPAARPRPRGLQASLRRARRASTTTRPTRRHDADESLCALGSRSAPGDAPAAAAQPVVATSASRAPCATALDGPLVSPRCPRRARRRRSPSSSGSGGARRSAATGGSSPSEAARRRTWPASSPPPISAASTGSRCRRRFSAWSTRPSAERPASTPTRGRTSPARSTFPEAVVIDPAYLATLPDAERRAGMAEVVKTGLLAGREVWSCRRTR